MCSAKHNFLLMVSMVLIASSVFGLLWKCLEQSKMNCIIISGFDFRTVVYSWARLAIDSVRLFIYPFLAVSSVGHSRRKCGKFSTAPDLHSWQLGSIFLYRASSSRSRYLPVTSLDLICARFISYCSVSTVSQIGCSVFGKYTHSSSRHHLLWGGLV